MSARRRLRRALTELREERARLAHAMLREGGDPLNPTPGQSHTQGLYDATSRAIALLEGRR